MTGMLESADTALLPGTSKLSIEELWAVSHAITISLAIQNLTNYKVLVSVRRENDSSVLMNDLLTPETVQNSTSDDKTNALLQHRLHTVEELSADTKYELCVSSEEQQQELQAAYVVKSECYLVRTMPVVDNITGVYTALVMVVAFLIGVGLVGYLFNMIHNKYFSMHGKYNLEQTTQREPMTTVIQDVPAS
ncbi:uncharacterized protein LOC121869338 isoform X2 [Homarus americanus]|uniref:uncharacterized protein LOC121869338 isoform X2 n=1 Tax=Homarus americanus TaxID=6706 RepID=UPI001C480D86|nr:uncharacterized protein LOC121869338 isoform X2 [Homarus americanus]